MERMTKSIVRLEAASGVDLSNAVGLAVGLDENGLAVIGGDLGVVTEAYQDGCAAAVFGGNAGPVAVKLAGTVSAGDCLVRNSSTGTFTEAAATDVAEARALEDGVAEERIAAVLLPPASRFGAEVYAAYAAGT